MDHQSGKWYAYVQGQLDRLSWNSMDFEAQSGVARQRLLDWRRGKEVSVEVARRLADVFGRPVLEVFVAAGYLTAEEARQQTTTPIDPATLSDDQLLREVRQRMAGDRPHRLSSDDIESKPDRYITAGSRRRQPSAAGDDEHDR